MITVLRLAVKKFLFHLSFIFILLITGFFCEAQISSTATGGNWSATTTWVGGVVPTASSNVIIVSGATVTVDVAASCAALNINNGTTGGGTAATLSFNSGTSLTVSGTVTVGASGGGRTGSIDMTNGGTLSAAQFTITKAGTWTPGSGTIALTATNTLPTNFFTTFNNLTISAGTTTTSRTLTIISNLSIADGAIFTAAGFALTVTGTTTIGNGTSGSLIISSTTGAKTFGGLITVNTGGTWDNSIGEAITIRGGITNNGTFTAGTGLYTFNTTAAQTLTGTISIPSMTVATGITVTNNGTLTVGTALAGAGGLTQGAASSTLLIGGTATITTLTATVTGNTVNYTGAGQTINSTNYYNLILSGSGTDVLGTGTTSVGGDFTLSGTVTTTTVAALTIGGNLSIGDGTTFNAAGFALTVDGTTTVGSGTSGTFSTTSAAGTKTFVGKIQVNSGATWGNTSACPITVEGGITNNGTFSATSTYTFTTNDQSLFGTMSMPSVVVTTITLTNTASNTFSVTTSLSGTGTFAQSANSVLNIGNGSTITSLQATASGNTVNYTRAGGQTINSNDFYNLNLSSSGTKTMQTGTTTIGGNFSLSGTVTVTAVVGLTVSGTFTIGTGTTFKGAGFTHTVTGNFTNNGTLTAGAGTTINFGANFTNNGTFTANSSTMVFNGSSAQTIGGTSATTFYGLTINTSGANNSIGVTLDDGINAINKTVTNTLTLTSGYLTTDLNNLIILNSGSSVSVATYTPAGSPVAVPTSTAAYVNGPMRKIGKTAFVFPVGNAGTGCVPIGISAETGGAATDYYDATHFVGSAAALGSITSSNLYNVSICEYWTLNRTVTGTPTTNVTGYWNENSPCNGEQPGEYVTDLTTISLAHFNTTATPNSWDNNSVSANSITVGGTVAGGVTWNTVSTFSPFALGNNNANKDNPLTIKLDYFTAAKENGFNQLSWKAECSTSQNYFDAQSSPDGVNFTTIDSVVTGNVNDCSQAFVYNDHTTASKIYYRIKMSDDAGNITYSDIKLITGQANAINFINVVPNPVKDIATLNISSVNTDKVELALYSIDGKQLQRKTIQVVAGSNAIGLETNRLAKGIYIVKGIFTSGETTTIKFVKE